MGIKLQVSFGRSTKRRLMYVLPRQCFLPPLFILPLVLATTMPATAQSENYNNDLPDKSNQRLSVQALVDLQWVNNRDAQGSWLKRGAQATRYADGDNGLQLAQAGVAAQYRINPAWHINSSLIYYPSPEAEFALTEAFAHYKPAPNGLWVQQFRLGAFHLPISLENDGLLWSAEHTLTPSVINSWVGEELRGMGAEWRWQLPGKHRQSSWDFDIYAALYGFNDTAGAMLAWRGWAGHDRLSGLASDYPITPIPIIATGELTEQEARYKPYVEVDERPGFYLGANTQFSKTLQLEYFYYDNQAQTEAIEDGQYGWRTRFHHIASQWDITSNTQLKAQWIEGDTAMGGLAVLAGFRAKYLLLARSAGLSTIALRWEDFSTTDLDSTPVDTNIENGESWTLNYAYLVQPQLKASIEYKSWKSKRPGRHYIAYQNVLVDAKQLLFSLRYYY